MVYALEAESISAFQRNYRLLSTAPIQKFDRAQLPQLVSDVLGLSRKPPAGALPTMTQIGDTHGLSKVAFAIVEMMVKQSESALDRDPAFNESDELTNRLEATAEDFRDAIDDLKQLGVIEEASYTGRGWQVRAKPELFAQFDQLFQPWNPEHDARTIASRLFANKPDGESIAAEKLAKDLGWESRRMNPAIQYLLSRDLIIRSKELGQSYLQNWLMPFAATRRFVKGFGDAGAP